MILVFLFICLASTKLNAQECVVKTNEMPVDQFVEREFTFKDLAIQINFNEEYKYRKSLIKARISNKIYHFKSRTFSEVVILKYLKKAARASATIEAFESYFSKRNLPFIDELDHFIVIELYHTMRKSTFNSYLEFLTTAYTTLYAIENSI
tara:strand:- start:63476 stop:63928 length:453 start_codon:yes stop_codon:yes gene_type:complete